MNNAQAKVEGLATGSSAVLVARMDVRRAVDELARPT